jgi:hypothetical protein
MNDNRVETKAEEKRAAASPETPLTLAEAARIGQATRFETITAGLAAGGVLTVCNHILGKRIFRARMEWPYEMDEPISGEINMRVYDALMSLEVKLKADSDKAEGKSAQ